MQNEKNISIAVIKRLPRYYRYLGDLLDNGVDRISSSELSKRMNITASQIRQDLNNFGCFGVQGYGYNVESLYEEIQVILGLTNVYNVIIVGAGNLGQALANYEAFSRRGFKFVALFDKDEKLVGKKIKDIEIKNVDTLDDYLQNNKVDIVVLALPKLNAEQILNKVKNYDVRGVWNFSNSELDAGSSLIVENVHLTDSLMTLSYKLREEEIMLKNVNKENVNKEN